MYILNDKKEPVLEKDEKKFRKWMKKNRIIKQSSIKQYFISTIFLGTDEISIHSLNYGYFKILFETMVFKNKNSKNVEIVRDSRHSTYEEAIDFHNEMVRKYKKQ